jgi:hypothetical protein
MSDMGDTQQLERRKSVSVPAWVLPIGRGAVTLAIGLAIGYARIVSLENKVIDNSQKLAESKITIGSHETTMNNMDRRISLAEAAQGRSEKEMGEALTRIESQLKELRQDVKDLQKNEDRRK